MCSVWERRKPRQQHLTVDFLISVCLRQHRNSWIFISGCLPLPASILQMTEEIVRAEEDQCWRLLSHHLTRCKHRQQRRLTTVCNSDNINMAVVMARCRRGLSGLYSWPDKQTYRTIERWTDRRIRLSYSLITERNYRKKNLSNNLCIRAWVSVYLALYLLHQASTMFLWAVGHVVQEHILLSLHASSHLSPLLAIT